MILTYRFRLKDKHAAELNRQARAVNYVWNYCNEMQQKAARSQRPWLTAFDLIKLTSGSSKLLEIHATTICDVCMRYAKSRKTHGKAWLRFRSKKSLGWIPLHQNTVRFDERAFTFRGVRYEPMHLRDMPHGLVGKESSFSQDARGRWYINVTVDVIEAVEHKGSAVGIDLGLKSLATLSTGEQVTAPQFYRRHEDGLAKARRARKKRLVATLSAKVANSRRDFLHKLSHQIATTHGTIIVGNVSSSKLAKTKFAKSVLDAGWSTLRLQLSHKAIRHGGTFLEVEEAYTSQTCSACGARPEQRPGGIASLAIREWTCSCGAVHDRDVNAARNILARGLASLEEGAARMRSSQALSKGPNQTSHVEGG